jgi:hypothetical protein
LFNEKYLGEKNLTRDNEIIIIIIISETGDLESSVLTYSFRITKRRSQEKQKIDRKTRKILTGCKIHHPKTNTHRLHVKMKDEGRGFLQSESPLHCALLEWEEEVFENLLKGCEFSAVAELLCTLLRHVIAHFWTS